jgi:hypothetical protein
MDGNVSMLMRNNFWGKTTGVFEIIELNKKLVCPWGHTKKQNELFNEDKFNNEKFSQIFINKLNVNDNVLLFDRNYNHALVLKIKSDPYTTKIDNVCIIRKRTCEHKPIITGEKCRKCDNSVIEIVSKSHIKNNFDDYSKYLSDNYEIESLYAIVRDIEIIGELRKGNKIYEKYKILRSSIAEPSEEIILGKKTINITNENKDDIDKHNYTNSKIINCSIDTNIIEKCKYKHILENIYLKINSGKKISTDTILNWEPGKVEINGFYYLDQLRISIQGVDSNKCLQEIINQCEKNNIRLKMSIELDNNKKINIDI